MRRLKINGLAKTVNIEIQTEPSVDSRQLKELLQELSEQQKQTHRDFDALKEENQDLYRQVGSLRRKHDKQQDTVNRLITFMIHFIQQGGGVSYYCLIE